jgi:hypothetical protein
MDHSLMLGMFVGGVVMMAPPVILGIGIAMYVLRQRRIPPVEPGKTNQD